MASLRDLILGTSQETVENSASSSSSSSSGAEEDEEEEDGDSRSSKRQKVEHHPTKKGSFLNRLLAQYGLNSTEKTSEFNARLAEIGATSLALDLSLTYRYCSRGHTWSQGGYQNPRGGTSVKAMRQVSDLRQATEQVALRGLMSRDLGIALSALGCRVRTLRGFDPLMVDCAYVLSRRDASMRECVSRWLDVVCETWTRPQFTKEIMYRKPRQEYYYKTYNVPKKDQLGATWIIAAQIAWLSGSNRKALDCLDSCATNTTPHVDQSITLRMNVFAAVAVARRSILEQRPSLSYFDIYDPGHLDDLFESLQTLSRPASDLVMRLDEASRLAEELAWKTATKQQQTWMIPLLACLEAAYFGACGNDQPRALRALLAIYPDTKASARAMVRLLSRENSAHPSYPRALVEWLKIEPASDFYGLPEKAVDVLYDASITCAFEDEEARQTLFPWRFEPTEKTRRMVSQRKKDPVIYAAAALHVSRFVCDNYDSMDVKLWNRLACAVADFDEQGTHSSARRRVFFAPGHDALWMSAFFEDTHYYKKDSERPLLNRCGNANELGHDRDRSDAFSTTFLTAVPPKLLLVGYRYFILSSISRRQSDRRFLTACRDAFKFEMSRTSTDETTRTFIRLTRDISMKAAKRQYSRNEGTSSDDEDDRLSLEGDVEEPEGYPLKSIDGRAESAEAASSFTSADDSSETSESSASSSSSSSSDSDVGVNPRRARPLK